MFSQFPHKRNHFLFNQNVTVSGFHINRNIMQVLFYIWFFFYCEIYPTCYIYLQISCLFYSWVWIYYDCSPKPSVDCFWLFTVCDSYKYSCYVHSSASHCPHGQWSISMNETAWSYGSSLLNFKESDQLFQYAILSFYQQCFRSLVFHNLTTFAAVHLLNYSHSSGLVVLHRGLTFILHVK